MSEAQNGSTIKGNRSKRSGATLPSGNTYLAARKPAPQLPFAKLPALDGISHHSRAGSVIQEDEGEEEKVLKRNAHPIVVENTYKMAPDPEKKFSAGKCIMRHFDSFHSNVCYTGFNNSIHLFGIHPEEISLNAAQ